jgi:hypothetical protein
MISPLVYIFVHLIFPLGVSGVMLFNNGGDQTDKYIYYNIEKDDSTKTKGED